MTDERKATKCMPPHPSHEQAVSNGRASGVKRRENIKLRETVQAILHMKANLLPSEIADAIKWLDPGMTVQDAIIVGQAVKAIMDKDTKAAEFLRDTSGQKPKDATDVTVKGFESALRELRGSKY